MTEPSKISDLISISLFQLDPRVSSTKEALWRSLVETALYHAERPLSQETIAIAITHLLEQPQMNISSEVQTAIDGCIGRGNLTSENDTLKLTEMGLSHVKDLISRAESDEKEFDTGLIKCVETELGFSVNDSIMLCSTVKYVLQEMFRTKGVEIQRLLDTRSLALEEALRVGATYDPIESIKKKIRPVSLLFGKGSEERLVAGIRKHFETLGDSAKRYVTLLYNKSFYHQILNLDPNLHAYQRSYFKSTRLYLDTNALIAYLFDGALQHGITTEIIDASKRLGFQVLISPSTLEEMNKFINNACQLFSSLGSDMRVVRLVTDTKLGRRSNPILVTFFIKKKGNLSLLWDNFISSYQSLEDFLLQKEILVEHEEYAEVRADQNYSKVWSTIREIRYEIYLDSIVNHDADNFVLIHKLRQKHKSHPMGPSVWLLTWDSNLCTAENRLRSIYPVPHCHILDDWGQIILPYQNINNFAFDDYILYLVRSSLGITVDMNGLDLNFLESLHKPEFDIDSLLELDDAEYVARILANMQENKEIRELAERARTPQTPEELSQISRQLTPRLFETVANDKKEAKESADRFARRVQELENRLHEIETRTFWQRLKALFGLQ